ncbi:hypothetical protein RQP46_001902 [Phenoliferia psychrophenolica]
MLSLRATRNFYATVTDSQTNNPGPVKSSPNGSKASNTPIFLGVGAALLVAGYYSFNNSTPPKTGSVDAIERAMAPKTEGANQGLKPSEGYTKRQ